MNPCAQRSSISPRRSSTPKYSKCVGDQQTTVLAPRSIVDEVVSATPGVVIDPVERVGVDWGSATSRRRLGPPPNLQLACYSERRDRFFVLASVFAMDKTQREPRA
jgi:hypothetical protein